MTREDIKHIVRAIKNYRQVNVSWFNKDDDFIAEQLETRFIDKPDLVITTSSAPEGLDEAAYKYSFESRPSVYGQVDVIDAFKAGAEWQKEQFEKNRLTACENQTKEEYDMETDFAIEIINKEHRQPTFSDAINYGMQLQKKQMENASIECLVCAGMEGDKWIMTYIGDYESMLKTCKAGDKVRIIILPKEDGE